MRHSGRVNVSHLLQQEELKASPSSQIPFQRLGMGPIPLSAKLFDSGHIPINTMQYYPSDNLSFIPHTQILT